MRHSRMRAHFECLGRGPVLPHEVQASNSSGLGFVELSRLNIIAQQLTSLDGHSRAADLDCLDFPRLHLRLVKINASRIARALLGQ